MHIKKIAMKIKQFMLRDNHISYNNEENKKDCLLYMYSNPSNIGIYNHVKYGSNSTNRTHHLMEPLSTTGKFIAFENSHKKLEDIDLINLLQNNVKNISTLRNKAVIVYLTAVNKNVSSQLVNISKEDIKEFVNIMDGIDRDVQEVDIIIHSRGGYMLDARYLVEILRGRFKKVTFMVPYIAHSAASMMCMSADEIIMTPESSLSPFDVQMLSPVNDELYPVAELKKIANEAKLKCSFLKLFANKKFCEDWNHNNINRTLFNCSNALIMTQKYTLYWLMKYLFNSHKKSSYKYSYYLILPWWIRFTKNGRKANKIVSFFTNSKIHIVHDNPILYHEINDIGLNIKCADKELLALLRETYILADELFNRTTLVKLYLNSNECLYKYEK